MTKWRYAFYMIFVAFSLVSLFFFDRNVLTSSLKKHAFYNLLINNILYLCVT